MKRKDSKPILPESDAEIDWSALDSLTDEEVEQAAQRDPDAQPIPDDWPQPDGARGEKRRSSRVEHACLESTLG